MNNPVQGTIKQIIAQKEPGTLVFPDDFLEYGSPEAIHTALSRLTSQKELVRMGKGIYLKPKEDPIVGQILPSLEEIARAIAAKEQVIIRPTGSYALNRLGLSTQVPTKVVFLTNGSPRTIKIGKGSIKFKTTTPKKLAAKDDNVFLVIQALQELGEDKISASILKRIKEVLQNVPLPIIRESAKFAPQFVARILFKLADDLVHYD